PGLGSLEVGVPPHKSAAVLRLILTVARLPRTLQFDVLSGDGALSLFRDRLGCVAQAYDVTVLRGAAGDRYINRLAAFAGGKRQLVADKGAPINRIAYLRRHRHSCRRGYDPGQHAGRYSCPLHCIPPKNFIATVSAAVSSLSDHTAHFQAGRRGN